MPKIPRKPITIGIVGSRRRASVDDLYLVRAKFHEIFNRRDRIVSGGCPTGGDRFAEIIARDYGCTIIIHHANWGGPDGKRAGFIRNTLIAEDCDVLLALVTKDRTGGSEDTVSKALVLGKEVILV